MSSMSVFTHKAGGYWDERSRSAQYLPSGAKIIPIPVSKKVRQPKILTQRKRELIRRGVIPATKGIVLPPMRKGA